MHLVEEPVDDHPVRLDLVIAGLLAARMPNAAHRRAQSRGLGGKLRRTGVHPLVDRGDALLRPALPDGVIGGSQEVSELPIARCGGRRAGYDGLEEGR